MEVKKFNTRKKICEKHKVDISPLKLLDDNIEELKTSKYNKEHYPKKHWEYYFSNIFPDSLKMFEAIARHQIEMGKTDLQAETFPKIDTDFMEERYDILVSLVGFSPEPIMHTICTLKPTAKIYLICSDGTRRFCKDSVEFKTFVEDFVKENQLKLNNVKSLNSVGYKNENIDIISKTVDSILPDEISNIVEEIIRENKGKRIAIDITGGKKTMLASAFTITSLYSIPAYYVDFQEYDNDVGKPVYGTEFLNQVTNPISSFIEELGDAFKDIDVDSSLTKKKLGNYQKLKEQLIRLGWRKLDSDQNTGLKNIPEYKKCLDEAV